MRLPVWFALCVVVVGSTRTPRRVLAFRKGSTFFYRMNYKINSLPYSKIFAQAAGFKVAWQLPVGGVSRSVRSISDLHESAELLYGSHGLNGKSCLTRNICHAMEGADIEDGGSMAKILKLLVGPNINSQDKLACNENSSRLVEECPLQLIGIDAFAESN